MPKHAGVVPHSGVEFMDFKLFPENTERFTVSVCGVELSDKFSEGTTMTWGIGTQLTTPPCVACLSSRMSRRHKQQINRGRG